MDKRFIKYWICLLVLAFTMSGCRQATASSTYQAVNKGAEVKKAGQEQTSTSVNTGSKKEADTKKESDSKEQPKAQQDENKAAENKAVATKEVKKNSKVIVIDPGHGGKSGSEKEKVSPDSNVMKPKNVSGAAGIKSKTPEHVIALAVSMKLKALLEKEGYTVIMTRTTAEQTISNIERAEIGNKNNADLVIRVHADSSTSSAINGASMLVPGEVGYAKGITKISRQYGEAILKPLVEEAKMKNKGVVVRKDLTGFNWSKVPVVLIEMGFLSNPEEDKLLNSSDYQQKIAVGLAKGIDRAFADKVLK